MSANLAALIRKLDEKGMSVADIADIIEGMSAPVPAYGMEATTLNAAQLKALASIEKRRAYDRERKRNSTGKSAETAETPPEPVETAEIPAEPSRTCEPAQVVNTTSSLRSEAYPPVSPKGLTAPTGAGDALAGPDPPIPKSRRGTRLPEDWEPSETDLAVARSEGLSDEEITRAATEFRNYWCSRSRDATKLSWPRTWHNRVIEIGDRKRRGGAGLAAASAKPGGDRRGARSFADIYARRHGYAAD